MRIIYNDLILVCDWAILRNDRIYFGTRSKEIFYIDCKGYDAAYGYKATLFNRGYLTVDNLHEARNEEIDCIADLVYNRIDW